MRSRSSRPITRGMPTADTTFRRIILQVPRLHVTTNAEKTARSAAMDGTDCALSSRTTWRAAVRPLRARTAYGFLRTP
jgi:hypothetical protein